MNKEEFIKKLKSQLVGLPKSEQDEVIADYEEYFVAGKAEKRSEEEIAFSLGDPASIAKQIKVSTKIKKAEDHWSAANILRAVLATAGLGFFNIIFILGPFIGLMGALIGFFAAGVGIIAGGVVTFIVSLIGLFNPNMLAEVIHLNVHPLASLLMGIALTCFGILFSIASWYLGKLFYILTVKYLKFNVRIITGDKE